MTPDANRSILHAVAIFGILGMGFWPSPAAAQLAPWQQPPGMGQVDLANDPGLDIPNLSSTPWAGEDYEQEGNVLGFRPGFLSNLAYESIHDRFWVHSEFLAWWSKGFATPPLLTTSPSGTDPSQAGVLGVPSTSVLFGGDDLSGGFRPGERITFGGWL